MHGRGSGSVAGHSSAHVAVHGSDAPQPTPGDGRETAGAAEAGTPGTQVNSAGFTAAAAIC